MSKKKKPQVPNAVKEHVSDQTGLTATVSSKQQKPTAPGTASSPAPLMIGRNKHWRYISSYHGPWLNLPLEVLENLAHSNYYSPRPRPIDPATLFDIAKIRRLVEDATGLSVCAVNGTVSTAVSTSWNAGNSSNAELLGIGPSRGGGNTKLSKERKHRMREQAIQKLSHAYHLDEIATSVATMQSTSALDEVAKHVLQKNTRNPDAQYVHFFHEKIPSLALAEHTSLEPLDDMVQQKPTEAGFYRTRAVTRLFKDDHSGAIRDLTDGLALHRSYSSQYESKQQEMVLTKGVPRLFRTEVPIDEKDQPSSLETQLLFHRGGAYLTLACGHIADALRDSTAKSSCETPGGRSTMIDSFELHEHDSIAMKAKKLVRTYAKRALRDYISFLSHFDYTPGSSADLAYGLLDTAKHSTSTKELGEGSRGYVDVDANIHNSPSEALVKQDGPWCSGEPQHSSPTLQSPVYKLSELFNAVPPPGIPRSLPESVRSGTSDATQHVLPKFPEGVTYHPLLIEVLHSLLLCHCLIQTSSKEHLRHAFMVARIARLCDGHPIFLSARSPARADWIAVLRCAGNWLGLEQSWETLCTPSFRSSQRGNPTGSNIKHDTHDQNSDRIKREAIMEALADERVADEDGFQSNVQVREARTFADKDQDTRKKTSNKSCSKVTQLDSSTENVEKKTSQSTSTTHDHRADAIARWIRCVPPSSAASKGKAMKSGPTKPRFRKDTNDMNEILGLESSIENLDMVD